MTKQDSQSPRSIENFQSPAWLADVLNESAEYLVFREDNPDIAAPKFQQRCRDAASLAMTLNTLRIERSRIGFVPLSLGNYIQGLFKVTNLSMAPILSWLNIKELAQLGSASALNLARLAHGIGIELREALIYLRIGFAEQIDGAPMPLLVARHRSATGGRLSSLEECESVLGEIELEYDLDALRSLRRAEFEFRSAYKEESVVDQG